MKKVILSVAAIAALGITSCRKAYTCKCESSGGGSTSVVERNELSKMALGDARAKCDEGDTKLGTITRECEIEL